MDNPIVLVSAHLSAGTQNFATCDFYDSSNGFWRGTITDAPAVITAMQDVFRGVDVSSAVKIGFQNADNGIDDTWDDFIAAEDIRNVWVDIQVYYPSQAAVDWEPAIGWAAEIEWGEGWVRHLYRGRLSGYTISDTANITVEMRREDHFETLLPAEVVDPDDWDATAIDGGARIPICFGRCRDVPLANVRNVAFTGNADGTTANKLVDSTASFSTTAEVGWYASKLVNGITTDTAEITAVDSDTQLSLDSDIFESGDLYQIHVHDYLIGYGEIEDVWEDATNGKGVKRDGVIANPSEYTLLQVGDYAFVRFIKEQRGHQGQMHNLTADVKGLLLGEATAQRNGIRQIQYLLSDATWGLSESVDEASFNDASTVLTDWNCDGAIYNARQAQDILNELLFMHRARLKRTTSGDWQILVDQASSSVATFGDGDGYYENCTVESVSIIPTSQALRTIKMTYAQNASTVKRVKYDVNSFGVDREWVLPFVQDDTTATGIISYLAKRDEHRSQKVSVRLGLEGRELYEGEVITLECPRRGLSGDYQIDRLTQDGLGTFRAECFSYSDSIFDTVLPTFTGDSGVGAQRVTGPASVVGDVTLGDGDGQPGRLRLHVSPGDGDTWIAAGKTDFETAGTGFILGIDDSDSDRVKFYLGDATDYLYWTPTTGLRVGVTSATGITIAGGGGILIEDGGNITIEDGGDIILYGNDALGDKAELRFAAYSQFGGLGGLYPAMGIWADDFTGDVSRPNFYLGYEPYAVMGTPIISNKPFQQIGINAYDKIKLIINNSDVVEIDPDKNIGFNTNDFGGGEQVIAIGNASTDPTTNPAGGGILYASGGALKYRGSSGTVTTIANA